MITICKTLLSGAGPGQIRVSAMSGNALSRRMYPASPGRVAGYIYDERSIRPRYGPDQPEG